MKKKEIILILIFSAIAIIAVALKENIGKSKKIVAKEKITVNIKTNEEHDRR